MPNNNPDLFKTIYEAIYRALEGRLHLVGSVLVGDSKQEIINQEIKDREDFYRNTEYLVNFSNDNFQLFLGSNVKHEPYVLGGKVPSYAPYEKIKGWVERKNLGWIDKKTKKALTVEQMTWMVIGKIKREGIKARNVFAEIINNKEDWILKQLHSIEVAI